jgi:UDP-GlcNAc:undecaprenyl-phosphate GlcNAc-1-phosphate transferase
MPQWRREAQWESRRPDAKASSRATAVLYILLAIAAAGLSFLATPLVRVTAVRVGAVDEPDARRVHVGRVPRLGGVAVLAAGLATLLLAPLAGVRPLALLALEGWHLGWLLAGVLLTVATGVVDDVWGIGPLPKLASQTAAAGCALAGGYGLHGIANPFTGALVDLGALSGPLTLVWIVAIVNAFNLIDGLDGLATGVALIASAALLAVAWLESRVGGACLWAVVLGALAGFLPYNFNPASIFLGDSGSLLLGYLLAVLSIQSRQKGVAAVVVTAPVLALGLPIMEMVLTVQRRAATSGIGSIARADRQHIHHRLLGRGVTHRSAVLILYAVCVALSGLSFLSVLVQGPGNALVVGLAAVVIYGGVRALASRPPRTVPDDGVAKPR